MHAIGGGVFEAVDLWFHGGCGDEISIRKRLPSSAFFDALVVLLWRKGERHRVLV